MSSAIVTPRFAVKRSGTIHVSWAKTEVANKKRKLTRSNIDHHHQSAAASHLDVVVCHVMRDVTVEKPATGLSSGPDHVEALSRPDVDRVSMIARGRLQRLTIHRDH